MNKVSQLLAVLGVLLGLYALVGRFVYAPTVFGYLIRGGMSASHAMLGANTLLVLAVLAWLYGRKETLSADSEQPKKT